MVTETRPGQTETFYNPNSRRFVVSPDSFSQQRFKRIVSIKNELGEMFPDIPIGVSLFGSLTKGKVLTPSNAPKTDIDMYVFFDVDSVGFNSPSIKLLRSDPDFSRMIDRVNGRSNGRFQSEVGRCLEGYLRYFIPKRFTDNTEELGFTSNPKLRDFIAKHIMPYRISHKGNHSIIGALNREAPTHIYFHWDVERGLNRYHHSFLKELSSLGKEKAEEIWKNLIATVEFSERGVDSTILGQLKAEYSQTFEIALIHYGLSYLLKRGENT